MRANIAVAAATILLSGCTDLTAVQNFASTGSTISTNETVISGWPHAYDQVTLLAGSASVRQIDPKLKQSFIVMTKKATDDAKLATQAAQLLGLYLQTLAQLAGGTVVDVSKQTSSIQTSLKSLGVTSPDVTVGTDALALVLNTWQNAAVGDVVKKANGPVKTITDFLAVTATEVRASYNLAAQDSADYWAKIGERSGSPAMQALIQTESNNEDTYYRGMMAKAATAQLAFTKIGTDHDALAQNASSLSGARATLLADLPLLESAAATLTK
jgi:hypothetical protein